MLITQNEPQYSSSGSSRHASAVSDSAYNVCPPAENSQQNFGITEVVLPEREHIAMVLPTLAFLSQQAKDRWFTWFPPEGINKPLLTKYGFNLPNVRLVHTKNHEQQLWYVWEALAEGNNHTVVASLGKLTDKRLAQLEHAARIGKCSGLLIRYR